MEQGLDATRIERHREVLRGGFPDWRNPGPRSLNQGEGIRCAACSRRARNEGNIPPNSGPGRPVHEVTSKHISCCNEVPVPASPKRFHGTEPAKLEHPVNIPPSGLASLTLREYPAGPCPGSPVRRPQIRVFTRDDRLAMHSHPLERPPLSRPVRVLMIFLAAGLMGLLGLARWLEPDPRGYGTHTQLGLGPCAFAVLTGRPCPTCGMTTSFAWLTRGRLDRSWQANPAGCLIAILITPV